MKDAVIIFKIPQNEKEEAQQRAKKEERSLGSLLRWLLKSYMSDSK